MVAWLFLVSCVNRIQDISHAPFIVAPIRSKDEVNSINVSHLRKLRTLFLVFFFGQRRKFVAMIDTTIITTTITIQINIFHHRMLDRGYSLI